MLDFDELFTPRYLQAGGMLDIGDLFGCGIEEIDPADVRRQLVGRKIGRHFACMGKTLEFQHRSSMSFRVSRSAVRSADALLQKLRHLRERLPAFRNDAVENLPNMREHRPDREPHLASRGTDALGKPRGIVAK